MLSPACHVNTNKNTQSNPQSSFAAQIILSSIFQEKFGRQYLSDKSKINTAALLQYFVHHNITCGVIHRVLTWDDIHSVMPPSLSFLTSETRINITNGHTPHSAHQQGGSCLFVYIYSITGIKELCQPGQDTAFIF